MKKNKLFSGFSFIFSLSLLSSLSACGDYPDNNTADGSISEIQYLDSSTDRIETEDLTPVTEQLKETSTTTETTMDNIEPDLDSNNQTEAISSDISSENISSLQIQAIVTAQSGLTLRKENSTKSEKIESIPAGTTVQILSIPQEYQAGDWDHQLVLVEYNGQQGYVHTDYLICSPSFDSSSLSETQLIEIGRVLSKEYFRLTNLTALGEGISNSHGTDEYDWMNSMTIQKLSPKGLKKDRFISDFHKYFSTNFMIKAYFDPTDYQGSNVSIDELLYEKDGYLWRYSLGGTEMWVDDYDVIGIESSSDGRIVYRVKEVFLPDTIRLYNEEIGDGGGGLIPAEYFLEIESDDNLWKFAACKKVS